MLDMNVTGLVLLAVSIIYTTIVTNEDASASVMMLPDADHVNTSIWPGVSKIAYLETKKKCICLLLQKHFSSVLHLGRESSIHIQVEI